MAPQSASSSRSHNISPIGFFYLQTDLTYKVFHCSVIVFCSSKTLRCGDSLVLMYTVFRLFNITQTLTTKFWLVSLLRSKKKITLRKHENLKKNRTWFSRGEFGIATRCKSHQKAGISVPIASIHLYLVTGAWKSHMKTSHANNRSGYTYSKLYSLNSQDR